MNAPANNDGPRRNDAANDAAEAIRFMAVKAAIFILVPAVAAAVAVWFTLK